jgi:hypothetical protein
MKTLILTAFFSYFRVMKKLHILIVAMLALNIAHSQPCLPEGIIFSTQGQIDNFQSDYPGCSVIEGNVGIHGNNITNLDSLSVLTSIGGYLNLYDNPVLASLTGLENLTSIGGFLRIFYNDSLTSLTGLGSLAFIGGNLDLIHNAALISLTDITKVTSIEGGLFLSGNYALTSLTGLEGLTSIGGNLSVLQSDALINLAGLNNVNTIAGYIDIEFNDILSDLTGLENLTSLGKHIHIADNNALSSLTGLEGLNSITGGLAIINNDALLSMTGMGNVVSMGSGIFIGDNHALTSLTGLDNVTSIGGELTLTTNASLTSLAGLDKIDAGSIDSLFIINNISLSTCEVESICDFLASSHGTTDIRDNAEGCNSQQEVEAACISGLDEGKLSEFHLDIFPDPTNGISHFAFCISKYQFVTLKIYEINGMVVATVLEEGMPAAEYNLQFDLSTLTSGIYFVRLTNDRTIETEKLVKW